jgi:hypothetical protein
MDINTPSADAVESRARRAAGRHNLRMCKSRRAHSLDNLGGFQLQHPDVGVVLGSRFDLSAGDVLDFCAKIHERS